MRVAVVQTNPAFGDVERNVKGAIALIESANADLYVLPELFNTGYNFVDAQEVKKLAEPADGYSFNRLSPVARKKNCTIVYGFAEQADRLYNSAALIGPDGLCGVYRKVHLYYRENLFFAPGNLGFPVFDLPFGRVGIMICFDWIYPESARTLALAGAEIILHPSNLVLPHCPDAMVTRCLENRVYAATANRIGRENRGGIDLSYIGKSEIVSPRGEILTRLSADETGVGVVDIDLTEARNKHLNEYNDVLAGRRTEYYRLA
ncbi:MAG: acyltransferase [Ignavibacteriae bacterium]|nr:acyltransferase [Ignavibacteria bacterium]MBI3363857.1 acyltransferase [Ignavibacteriota bacterium]